MENERQKLADTPTLFRETKNPDSYIVVPRVSSENRRYIPVGFLNEEYIPTDSVTLIPNTGIFAFGIISSNVREFDTSKRKKHLSALVNIAVSLSNFSF